MEQVHTDSTDSGKTNSDEKSLADYVKRMETDENLRKLAKKLKGDLTGPGLPELPFEKFEQKLRDADGQ